MKKLLLLIILFFSLSVYAQKVYAQNDKRPNILVCIADDWGFDAPIYGNHIISVPNFDKIVQLGVYFTNAFVAAPTCTASRAGILTGRCPASLGKGANLFGTLDAKYDVYPDILEKAGYQVGFTGKGWGPGSVKESGRKRNPAGNAYNEKKLNAPYGISNIDYAENFKVFMNSRDKSKPFCFWYGGHEPHRPYKKDIGKSMGQINECSVEVPGFYPDRPEIKGDLADYYFEVHWFDNHLGKIIDYLKAKGEYDNTIIVVTGDNGFPFPRGKAGLYLAGIHAPLAISWPDGIKVPGREITDFVSLRDMFATFLDAAGIPVPKGLTSKSIIPLLESKKSGRIDSTRNHAYAMRERHAAARENTVGYPVRAIVTDTFLYLRNFEPDRSPHGDLLMANQSGPLADTDPGPTKFWLLEHRNDPIYSFYFNMSFAKRPAEELYLIKKDPYEFNNLACNDEYKGVLEQFRRQLKESMKDHDDPRYTNKNILFDTYKYAPLPAATPIAPKDLKKWYYSNLYPEK